MNKWSVRIIIGVVILTLVGTGVFFFVGSEKKDSTQVSAPVIPFKPFDTTSTKVVAKYNGGNVTEGELNTLINIFGFFQQGLASVLSKPDEMLQFKQSRLQDIASKKYMASKVKDSNDDVKKANEIIKELEKQQQENLKTKDSLEKMIQGKGCTIEQIKNLLIQSIKVQRFYDSKLKTMKFENLKARHILIMFGEKPGMPQASKDKKEKVRTEAEAKKLITEIKQKLDKGEDFAKLAKQYTDDLSSKEQGGLIEGAIDQFVPEFSKVAKTIKYGKISDIIKVKNHYQGFHILKVDERSQKRFDQAPPQLKEAKMNEISQKIMFNELKYKSLLPMPKPAEQPEKPAEQPKKPTTRNK